MDLAELMAGVFGSLAAAVISGSKGRTPAASVTREPFGTTRNGESVELFTLSNLAGIRASATNYGATLIDLTAPDRAGNIGSVVAGFATLSDYEQHRIFLGATIGRYANRIANGRFRLGGTEYKLATNNGPNHLHGGEVGFDRVVWTATRHWADDEGASLELSYTSPDGDEGYPGELRAFVTYTLTNRNELRLDYRAETDRETIVGLTNHSYFNLAGDGDILSHTLQINGARFTPTDDSSIPTGELKDVHGTPFDFTAARPIGSRISEDDEQLRFGKGYDHNWVLDKTSDGMTIAAEVYEPASGRVMEVLTTEPGLQFYSGNFLDGGLVDKNGQKLEYRSAFCLEAQHFPDSPNRPEFPSVVLRPGEEYRQTTIYRFSVR